MEKSEETRELALNFTPEDIVNKDFKQKYRGYDAAEVDPFLDKIIQDYEAFNNRIKTLETENQRLVTKVDETSQQPSPTSTTVTGSANNVVKNTTNYDILRRLSNLERHVFGEKQAEIIANKPANTSTIARRSTGASLTEGEPQSTNKPVGDSTENGWLNRF